MLGVLEVPFFQGDPSREPLKEQDYVRILSKTKPLDSKCETVWLETNTNKRVEPGISLSSEHMTRTPVENIVHIDSDRERTHGLRIE